MRSRRAVFLGVAAVLVVGFILSRSFERVEADLDVGYRGAARANPFLAAERFYSGMGVKATYRLRRIPTAR